MLNLDVAVASFWQLARHWKQGDKAKLELVCEDRSFHMKLSTELGHPDHPQFHPPSPPCPPSPPTFPALKKKKSPSQLHREKRRREATCRTPLPNLTASSVANAEDAKAEQASTPTIIKETVEVEDGEAGVIANVEEPAV